MGAQLSSDNMCGYGGRSKDPQSTASEYTPAERDYVKSVFRKLDKNGDSRLEAKELEEKMVDIYMRRVKEEVRGWMAQHKCVADPEKSYITEDDFLEFNRPFVVQHRGQRPKPTLLSTNMLSMPESALVATERAGTGGSPVARGAAQDDA